MKHSAVICLGSNIADRHTRIDHALMLLSQYISIEKSSEELSSDDVSGRGLPYLNKVIKCNTFMDLNQLRKQIAEIETLEGRTEQSKTLGKMPIDIDIVLWDNEVISQLDFERPYFQKIYNTLKLTKQAI